MPANQDALGTKVDRMGVSVGRLNKLWQALSAKVFLTEKTAVLELRQRANIACPDTSAVTFTSRTVNMLISDPDGVIQNPNDFIAGVFAPTDPATNTNTAVKLGVGDYYIEAQFLGGALDGASGFILTKLRLYDPSISTGYYLVSLNGYNNGVGTGTSYQIVPFILNGYFSVSGATRTLNIQQCTSAAGHVLGVPVNFNGEDEIYGRIVIKKLEKVSLATLLGL